MGKTLYELDANGDILLSVYNVPYDLPQDWRELDGDMLAGFSEPEPVEKPAESDGETEDNGEPNEGSQEPVENTADGEIEEGNGEPNETSLEPAKGPTDGETEEDNGSSEPHVQSVLQIRASSKHLTLSCPQFERTLQQGFREGNELQSTGCLELPIEDWEAMPFLILMMIIHGRTRAVPREISLERLSEMAVLVDYYECYEVVEVFSEMWIYALGQELISSITDAERWLFISWVFQRSSIFQASSHYLQREDKDKLLTKDFPIPSHVRGAIDESRETAIGTVVQYLNDTIADLQDENTICDYECDCIMLGALTKHMHRMRILPLELNPSYRGLNFVNLKSSLREMKYPGPYKAEMISFHSCILSLPSKIDSSLDLAEESLQGLDIESFKNPGESE